jgi:predicted nucleotidyltransferase/HEPN domain-containing protein
MRSDLDHLPLRQREELRRALDILFTEFQETLKTKLSPERRNGRILKVVLYGSHARGDWVIDRPSYYVSDFDLLVVVDGEEFTDFEYWERAEDRFGQLSLVHPYRPSPSLIVHSLSEMNDQLARGRYFFIDILREGIMLYESEGHPFVEPQPLTPEVAQEEAQGHFDYWFPLAEDAINLARLSLDNGSWRYGAFLYDQAVEQFYHCTLLVLTLYTPKLHDIEELRRRCEGLDQRLIEAWPRNSKFARRCFQRLKRAYVDARYSKHHEITAEELAWIAERIAILREIVRTVCEEWLSALGRDRA